MKEDKLKREVSGFSAFIMVIGTIIGSGVFFKPTAVFGATGTAGLGLLAWGLGGGLALAGGLTIAEIGTLIPQTGGMMTYMEAIYGKFWGYLIAWVQTIIFYPVRIEAATVICATQAANLLGLGKDTVIPIAVAIVLFVNFVNAIGNKATDILQNLATFLKFIPLILIIVAGLLFNPDPVKVELIPFTDPGRPLGAAISAALLATLYATDGWMNVTNIAGEMKDPGRDLPKAIVGGISMVTLIYLAINVAYLRVLPANALAATATPASDVAGILFSSFGGKLITIGIMISVFGSQTGFVRASWRIPYALGLRDMLPFGGFFRKLNQKTDMPVNSGMFLMALTIIMLVCIGDFNILTDIGSFVIWFFYILTFAGIFILRKKWPDRERPYKVPLYPLVPILGAFGGIFVLVSTIMYQPFVALISIVCTLTGVPLYLYLIKKNQVYGGEE
ncbi:APC family permease [Enterocloster citroniae]|uniref:APC family permease n=1 Tax=Enterocloster citroniae TaxID=358743 RepID=UPI001897D696|nr:amino acid permease [Enterocloster citroniae]